MYETKKHLLKEGPKTDILICLPAHNAPQLDTEWEQARPFYCKVKQQF